MFRKKLSFLIVLSLSFSTVSFAQTLEERLQDIRAFRDYERTVQEQQILDHLDDIRAIKGIDVLEVNPDLCKAMRDRVQKIINDEDTPDTVSTVDRLLEFISYLGGKTFLIKGHSIQEILDSISQNTDLCRELELSDNIKLGFCCVKDTLTDYLYSAIYVAKYYIEFFPPIEAKSFFSPSGASVTWFMNLNGKANARYLKYVLYPGDTLPFYYTGNYILTEEFQTDQDGFFSFKFSFHVGNYHIGRVAIFAKNDIDEPYSLIQFGPM